MCLKQKHTDQLTSFQRCNMQASPGKIPIGACLTWLLKAYFTLYWLTSFHFLPSSACTHPCLFYFLFSTPLPSPCETWELSGNARANKGRQVGFFFFCCAQLFLQNIWSVFHLHKHVAVWNETALGLKKCVLISFMWQTSKPSLCGTKHTCKLRRHDWLLVIRSLLINNLAAYEHTHTLVHMTNWFPCQ